MYKKKEFKKLTSLYDVHVYKGVNGIAMRYCHKKLEYFKGKEKYNNVLEIGAGTTPHIDYIKHKFDNYYIAETSEASIKHYENDKKISISITHFNQDSSIRSKSVHSVRWKINDGIDEFIISPEKVDIFF